MSPRDQLARLEQELAKAAGDADAALVALNEAKDREDRALRSGASGRRLPQATWSRIIGDVKAAGRTHQEALVRVSRIKKAIKPLKIQVSEEEHREYVATTAKRELGFAEHFMNVAREMLDSDVFATLMKEATLRKNRDLVRYQGSRAVGSAIGVRGAVGGMKERA